MNLIFLIFKNCVHQKLTELIFALAKNLFQPNKSVLSNSRLNCRSGKAARKKLGEKVKKTFIDNSIELLANNQKMFNKADYKKLRTELKID